jgi:hypothetical protein
VVRRQSARADAEARVIGPTALDQLCVLTACHDWVCALEAPCTERLALPGEVQRRRPAGGARAPGVPIVEHNDVAYAAWNLGTLLELAPTSHTWILLQIPHRDAPLRLALAAGPCLAVRPLTARISVPRGVFRDRAAAIQSAFAAREVVPKATSPVGYVLDVRALWTVEERDASASALAAARAEAP